MKNIAENIFFTLTAGIPVGMVLYNLFDGRHDLGTILFVGTILALTIMVIFLFMSTSKIQPHLIGKKIVAGEKTDREWLSKPILEDVSTDLACRGWAGNVWPRYDD